MAVLALVFLIVLASPLQALEFMRRGDTLIVTGTVRPGDDFRLRARLAEMTPSPIRVIALASDGGQIGVARRMAWQIRAAGLTTFVDGGRSACHSACTLVFAGGVRRHYGNAARLPDAVGDLRTSRGLGFHAGATLGRHGRRPSGAATAAMITGYAELGVPGAARLVSKARFDRIYRISGGTALALGIATDLTRP